MRAGQKTCLPAPGGDGDRRMHIGRSADPDDIDPGAREGRPVLHGLACGAFLAEFSALSYWIRDRRFDFVMLFNPGRSPRRKLSPPVFRLVAFDDSSGSCLKLTISRLMN